MQDFLTYIIVSIAIFFVIYKTIKSFKTNSCEGCGKSCDNCGKLTNEFLNHS